MDYIHISNFLDKLKKILFQEEEIQIIISKTISQYIPTQIDYKIIKIKGSIIYIKSSPMLRSEILIHKKEILDDLTKSIVGRRFNDIR